MRREEGKKFSPVFLIKMSGMLRAKNILDKIIKDAHNIVYKEAHQNAHKCNYR